MRLALTGSSSTGKTTLLTDLRTSTMFEDYYVSQGDTRTIMDNMGISSQDLLSDCSKLRRFQWAIFEDKVKREGQALNIIAERSFIDYASYWLARCRTKDDETIEYVQKCMEMSRRYDLHVHLPANRLAFEADGYRPENMSFQRDVAEKIVKMLDSLNCEYLTVETCDHRRSVEIVCERCRSIVF